MTRREKELYDFIRDYRKATDGISPSYGEMAVAMKLASKDNIHRLLKQMRSKGLIYYLNKRARTVRVIEG